MKIALIQFNAGPDKDSNIIRALDFTRQAVEAGARFVVLPEIYNFRGDTRDKKLVRSISEKIPGPSTKPFIELARDKGVQILIGSIFERAPQGKAYNTSVFIDRGHVGAKYRKIHLFDARLGDKIIRESECFRAGHVGVKVKVGLFSAGLSICYDLRFPLLYSKYAKARVDMVAVPSCFTQTTGQAHWEVLLRARAIEGLCYVLAPNQVGSDGRGGAAYGNSMVVAPWGEVVARGSSEREEIVWADVSAEVIQSARARLPGIIKK